MSVDGYGNRSCVLLQVRSESGFARPSLRPARCGINNWRFRTLAITRSTEIRCSCRRGRGRESSGLRGGGETVGAGRGRPMLPFSFLCDKSHDRDPAQATYPSTSAGTHTQSRHRIRYAPRPSGQHSPLDSMASSTRYRPSFMSFPSKHCIIRHAVSPMLCSTSSFRVQ